MNRQQTNQVAAEALIGVSSSRQCAAVFSTRHSATFCVKRAGHAGDHRGLGKQWNQAGLRVKITEPVPS